MRITYPDGTFTEEPDCADSCPGSTPDPWTSHPDGKFDDCRTEALYYASLDWQPEQTGDVDWYVWACILSFPVGEYLSPDGEYPAGDEPPPADAVWIPAGEYVLCCDDRGAVWIESSPADGHGASRARFDAIDAEYSAWLDSDDGEEEELDYSETADGQEHKDIEGSVP